jgi:DNA-binding transcriptional regulator LsrR (DeoR family)
MRKSTGIYRGVNRIKHYKCDNETVAKLKKYYLENGCTIPELANKFNVSLWTATRITNEALKSKLTIVLQK